MHMPDNNQMEQMVQDHEKRISQLEKNYDEVRREMTTIHNGQLRIENTLLIESKEQKELLKKLIDQKFGLDVINTSGKWRFFITALGSGGILYLLFELLK